MKIYSYVVAHDSGLASNPFHGLGTLACCKPRIRAVASVGDIVVGLTARSERVAYAMKVSEVLNFEGYWHESRFLAKRPRRLVRQAVDRCGDNIYESLAHGQFRQ